MAPEDFDFDGTGDGSGNAPDDDQPKPAASPDDAVDKIAQAIKQGINVTVEAPAPAAPAEPAVDPEAEQRAANEMMAQYQELAAEGKHAEALTLAMSFVSEQQARQAKSQDPTKAPGYTALVNQAERLAKAEHADMFDKYGAEIRAVIDSLPADKRFDPAAWDEAVGTVTTNHREEIISAEVDRRLAEAAAKGGGNTVPTNTPGRGSAGKTSASAAAAALTPEELGTAKSFGLSPEEYAAAKAEGETSVRDGGRLGGDGLVDVLKPAELLERDGERIKPGSF